MKVNVVDITSKASGTISIKDEIFCLEPRKDILHRIVLYQLAKRRAGTHKVKNFGFFWVLPLGTHEDWVPKIWAPKGYTRNLL